MQLLAKFKKILYMGFRATLNFRKFNNIKKNKVIPQYESKTNRHSLAHVFPRASRQLDTATYNWSTILSVSFVSDRLKW